MARQKPKKLFWLVLVMGLAVLMTLTSCDVIEEVSAAAPPSVQGDTSSPGSSWQSSELAPAPTAVPLPPPSVPVAVIQVGALNVRTGPGMEYDILGTAAQGTQWLIVNATSAPGWLAILVQPKKIAWIAGGAQYVRQSRVQVDNDTYNEWLAGMEVFENYPAPQPVPQWSPAPSSPDPQPVCSCSRNQYNCDDFGTQRAAQACYQYCLQMTGRDIHWLDGDNDGIACEWNP